MKKKIPFLIGTLLITTLIITRCNNKPEESTTAIKYAAAPPVGANQKLVTIPPSKDTSYVVITATTNTTTSINAVVTTSPTVPPIPPDTTVVIPPVTGIATFKGDWTKTMGNFTTSNLGPSNYAKDGNTWHGIQAVSFALSPLDLAGGCKSPDCNRNEVAELPGDNGGINDETKAIGTTVYFGSSFKIASSFKTSPRSWMIPLQLHGPSDYGTNPLFCFDIGGKTWKMNAKLGDVNSAPNKGYAFKNGVINYDKWTDFVIAVNFQRSATGSINVYRRDEGESKFTLMLTIANTPTYQFKGSGALLYHYWKTGLYGLYNSSITDKAWLGPFSRATSFAAAEFAAFGTNNGF